MKYLILSAGGMGIFAYLGYFKKHEELLGKVEEISGASCGAVLGTMISMGFTIDQIIERIQNIDFKTLSKSNLKSLIRNFGLIDHEPIR